MDDSKIIDLFYNRSETAITEISRKYGSVCMNTAYNILGSKEDAQECVNDAYLGVWNTIPPARPNPLLSFVLRIVRNLSINRMEYNHAAKRSCVYQECIDELCSQPSSPDTPESVYDAKLLSGYIGEFLDGLGKTNRLLFVRRYWYMDSVATLSDATGLRQGAIRTRLSRLREQLRQHLLERGVSI